MLVSAHVSAALVASFRRADVPTSCRPAAARTFRAPSAPSRWLSRFHHVMLGMLVVTAVSSSAPLQRTVPTTIRAGVQTTISVADTLLAHGQQVLGHGAATSMNTGTTAPASLRVGANARYRIFVPMARTAPRSTAPASIDLSKYPTEYAANDGYVYTGRRAQVLHHIQAYYSERTTTYATHSECATCSADLWTAGARGGVDNTAMPNMNAMAEYLRTNAAALGFKYVIWNQQISIGGRAWQEMEDRGSITANHKDHVHITFADSFK